MMYYWQNIFSWTITDRTACAVTSQNRCHGRSPSQYGWFPVQHLLGSTWLAHHKSPSACWGKGPGYLCLAHIQSSYWSLNDEVRWRKEWKHVHQHCADYMWPVNTGAVSSNYSLRSTSVLWNKRPCGLKELSNLINNGSLCELCVGELLLFNTGTHLKSDYWHAIVCRGQL